MPSERDLDILLYGATGFTGRLIARQLDKRGVNFAVAGRNRDKVEKLSQSLKSNPPALTASVDNPTSLEVIFRRAKVVISAAGPFVDVGHPVVAAAVAAGAHYL